MSKDNVIALENPSVKSRDPLTEVLRRGASKLLAQAIETEVETLLALYADRRDEQGRQALVRNGYLPERDVQTGIGAVPVKVPRVRDRSHSGIRFHSGILPVGSNRFGRMNYGSGSNAIYPPNATCIYGWMRSILAPDSKRRISVFW
jgi:hypothetical protein